MVNRGRLTFWFEEDSLSKWYTGHKSGKRGASTTYSVAILCGLTLRAVFRLPLRATEGLVLSLIELMGLKVQCRDYSTFCRRQKDLIVPLVRSKKGEAIHVVVDSSGLKVYGEG